jgi:hypothetical protein
MRACARAIATKPLLRKSASGFIGGKKSGPSVPGKPRELEKRLRRQLVSGWGFRRSRRLNYICKRERTLRLATPKSCSYCGATPLPRPGPQRFSRRFSRFMPGFSPRPIREFLLFMHRCIPLRHHSQCSHSAIITGLRQIARRESPLFCCRSLGS